MLTILRELSSLAAAHRGALRIRVSVTDGWLLRLWLGSRPCRNGRAAAGRLSIDGIEVVEDRALWPGQVEVD